MLSIDVLLGLSGSGKTVIASNLKDKWKRDFPDGVCGLIMSENEQSFERDIQNLYLRENIQKPEDGHCQELIERLMKLLRDKYSPDKKILLVFDDLDELYTRASKAFKELKKGNLLKNTKIVVTSQHPSTGRLPDGFMSVKVNGFNRPKAEEYLEDCGLTPTQLSNVISAVTTMPVALAAFKGSLDQNKV